MPTFRFRNMDWNSGLRSRLQLSAGIILKKSLKWPKKTDLNRSLVLNRGFTSWSTAYNRGISRRFMGIPWLQSTMTRGSALGGG